VETAGRTLTRLGIDARRPWISVLPEPSVPPARTRAGQVARLSAQVKGLTVAQFPNPPLAAWLVASIAGRVTSGSARDIADAIAVVALSAWAYEELADGTNWFRRCLGAGALVVVVAGLAGRISS
jgi:hypothetical protein